MARSLSPETQPTIYLYTYVQLRRRPLELLGRPINGRIIVVASAKESSRTGSLSVCEYVHKGRKNAVNRPPGDGSGLVFFFILQENVCYTYICFKQGIFAWGHVYIKANEFFRCVNLSKQMFLFLYTDTSLVEWQTNEMFFSFIFINITLHFLFIYKIPFTRAAPNSLLIPFLDSL